MLCSGHDLDRRESKVWNTLTDRTDRVFVRFKEGRTMTDKDKETFVNVSLTLNSMLPKVSNSDLSALDDVFYPGADAPEMNDSGKNVPVSWEVDKWVMLYAHFILNGKDIFKSRSRIMETTCLQLIEHSLLKTWFSYNVFEIWFPFIDKLLNSGNEFSICLAIKNLRMFADRYGEEFKEHVKENNFFEPYIIWMLKLKNIPQVNHPDEARLTSWISTQASQLHEKLSCISQTSSICYKGLQMYDLLQKDLDEKIFLEMLDEISSDLDEIPKPVWFEFCYKFFMSAKSDAEKLHRMKLFVQKLYARPTVDSGMPDLIEFPLMLELMVTMMKVESRGATAVEVDPDDDMMRKMVDGATATPLGSAFCEMALKSQNNPIKCALLKQLYAKLHGRGPSGDSSLVKILHDCIERVIHMLKYNWCNSDQLRQMDSRDIKPYLTEDDPDDVADGDKELVASGFGHQAEAACEEDFLKDSMMERFQCGCKPKMSGDAKVSKDGGSIIGKYFFYDNFMKTLELISIINLALMKGQEEDWADIRSDDVADIYKGFANFASNHPPKSWFVETLQKYCPFMLPKVTMFTD